MGERSTDLPTTSVKKKSTLDPSVRDLPTPYRHTPHLTPLSVHSLPPSTLPFGALKQWENLTPLIQSQGPKHSHVRLTKCRETLHRRNSGVEPLPAQLRGLCVQLEELWWDKAKKYHMNQCRENMEHSRTSADLENGANETHRHDLAPKSQSL